MAKSNAAAEWGLPNWLDAPDYGDTKSWGEVRWRWEFTRRREDFRADFDAGVGPTEKHYRSLYTKMFGKAAVVLTRNDPGFASKTSVQQVTKYGTSLFNPRFSDQPQLSFQHPPGTAGIVKGKGDLFDPPNTSVPAGVAAVRVDLDRPIAGQLHAALGYLSHLQEKRHGRMLQARRHRRTWFRYLRVLDGRECGASWSEIFKVVIAPEKGANLNPIQEARRTWEGARDLMFNWPP